MSRRISEPERTADKPRFAALARSIHEELDSALGDAEQVARDCAALAARLDDPPTPAQLRPLKSLAALLAEAGGDLGRPVFALLAQAAGAVADPWPLLRHLLAAQDDELAREAARLLTKLLRQGRLIPSTPLLKALDGLVRTEGCPLGEPAILAGLAKALRRAPNPARSGDPLLALLRGGADPAVRRLAAELLDALEEPIAPATAERLLGARGCKLLYPYLKYTRAGHRDLMTLTGGRPLPRNVIESFARAEQHHGGVVLRGICSRLPWSRLNLGLEIRPYVQLQIEGAPPLAIDLAEADLFRRCPGVTVGGRGLLVTAHGGAAARQDRQRTGRGAVDRFRSLNIAHAELLGEILDVAPLDRRKVEVILAALDRITVDYHALFADISEECQILPEVYGSLRARVQQELERTSADGPLSPELTRLVQMFEDPASLGQVRTLHGLKRYLHQKGLKLGFELVDTSHAPNRTVDLLLMLPRGRIVEGPTLRYAQFEAAAEVTADPWLPFPVRLAVDGLARQLLVGQQSFPGLDVFLFGNEVHYYLFFRNHPVFLRVDFSPPQRGGMIDLEYYGVSDYEVSDHPNLSLDAIRRFFGELQFDVRLEGTRLFVRFDKESCRDLDDLCDKASALMRLAPYLMDLDWIIGSLDLEPAARGLLVAAWAERFRRCGVLPLRDVLSADRRGVLRSVSAGPTGPVETVWDGRAPYRDRCHAPPATDLPAVLHTRLEALGLQPAPPPRERVRRPLGLLRLERTLLAPLRRALHQGRLELDESLLRAAGPEVFRLLHPAEVIAARLAEGGPAARRVLDLARPLALLERFTEFETIGRIGALEVMQARLTVRGGTLTLAAVRDGHGVVRGGAATTEDGFCRRRRGPRAAWRDGSELDAARLWSLLRSANYVAAGGEPDDRRPGADLAELQELGRSRPAAGAGAALEAERILTGHAAAPGRAVGPARFGTGDRRPEDLDGAVLFAREIRPADSQFLFHAAGIVSTGGAVLSHAALLAIQFGKPALVASGQWEPTADGAPTLHFSTTLYREDVREIAGFAVCLREVDRRRADILRDGDLVILDADEGVLRTLGQERDTLALFEGFAQLDAAAARAQHAADDREVLAARADRVRASHQISKILDRLTDPVLAAAAVEEIVSGRLLRHVGTGDRIGLQSRLLANAPVGAAARDRLLDAAARLAERRLAARRRAAEQIPDSRFLYEVIGLRLRALRWAEVLNGAGALLAGCGLSGPAAAAEEPGLDATVRGRLEGLLAERIALLQEQPLEPRPPALLRHLLRRIDRLGAVLGHPATPAVTGARQALKAADAEALTTAGGRFVLAAKDCGFAFHPLVGWKAANLAEIERLLGPGIVPPWFAVTDRAFRRVLAGPLPRCAGAVGLAAAGSLRDGIAAVLARQDLSLAFRSVRIRNLWEHAEIPEQVVRDVTRAYAALCRRTEPDPFLAIRSSSCDEDTESAMRAGEFETFLYVRGLPALLDHLKLTWAGLWTERALHTRERQGAAAPWPSGGLIVQRMAAARVAGVLQTVNTSGDDFRELLVNAGLGLGEGLVSGRTAADQITVVKEPVRHGGSLRFNYLNNEKPEQVVFDDRRGHGTRLEPTLYHQRLRPALDYLELEELVRRAEALETAYGYPLDIEFALEGERLWLLQARPVATFLDELNETLERRPLAAGGTPPASPDSLGVLP